VVVNGYRAKNDRLVVELRRNEELARNQVQLQAALERADHQAGLTEATMRLSQLEQYSSIMRMASTKLQDPSTADPMLGASVALQPEQFRHFEWSFIHGILTPTDAASRENFAPRIQAVAPAPLSNAVYVGHGTTLSTLELSTLERGSSVDLGRGVRWLSSVPDGSLVVSVFEDGTAEAFTDFAPGASGYPAGRPIPGDGYIRAELCPKGEHVLLVHSSGTLARWTRASDALDWIVTEPTIGHFRDLVFNKQGTLVAMSHQRRLILASWPDGRIVQRLDNTDMGRGPRTLFWGLDFSEDGTRLLCGNTFGVSELDLTT
jgi:hypothetical protein